MTTTLADLEARVAALEAERADYRAVLTSVNALGLKLAEHQQETRERLDRQDGRLDRLESRADDTNARVRSMEDNVSELKDLVVRALDNR